MAHLSGILLALASACWGASPARHIVASGYVKELWHSSRSITTGSPYALSLSRARLSLEGQTTIFKAHVDYDHELFAGSYFRTPEYRTFGLGEPAVWLHMDQDIHKTATSLWRHRLYRGWAGIESDSGLLRFGRQRVAWGTGKFWNPTDILNPYQPTSLEREERRGVDALYARQGLGTLSQLEAAWAPEASWPAQILLGRAGSNWKDYDFSLMGGKVASSTSSWMLGGDFAGNLWDGTFHGEWSYTDLKTRTPFWKVDVGYEYTFPSETTVSALKDLALGLEYFHNGQGIALARDYLGFSASKDVHPLLKLELFLITNLNDGSRFLGPSLQWNALENLYLTGGFQRFGGRRSTEFGRPANITFLQGQYYF
ncbi:MAG: hypothetical protein HY921_10720 [Elusimicrobia bacterium]|nr:hypothetical protein [Elusimicrobiota bacterium]